MPDLDRQPKARRLQLRVGRSVLALAGQGCRTDLGHRSFLQFAHGNSHAARLRQAQHGPSRRGTDDAEAMGHRDVGAPAVVSRRPFQSPGCEPIPAPTLHQLQHARWLISIELAGHYRELGSADEQVGLSDRRRFRQDFEDRRAADELQSAGLRLREVTGWWPAMGRSRPTAIPFSAMMLNSAVSRGGPTKMPILDSER